MYIIKASAWMPKYAKYKGWRCLIKWMLPKARIAIITKDNRIAVHPDNVPWIMKELDRQKVTYKVEAALREVK